MAAVRISPLDARKDLRERMPAMLKRSFDIAASLIGLTLLAPVLLPVMLLLRLTGEGEVFFFQQRMGYRNRPFLITKFATMLKSAAVMKQGDYTVENDPRVLPVGKFLRKSKVNELLQLWDVLRGQMSLVGPRPQVLRIHALYPPEFAPVLERFRPGITGLGSLVFRDEERILTRAADRDYCYTRQIIPHKVKLELWYADHQSVGLDMLIIFLTVWYVIRPNGTALRRILPADLWRDASHFDGVPAEAAETWQTAGLHDIGTLR